MPSQTQCTLVVFRCKCRDCEMEFDDVDFSDFAYGEKLLRIRGHCDIMAYASLTQDPVASEVSKTLDRLCGTDVSTAVAIGQFERAFSLTCDTLGGHRLDMSWRFSCPRCGGERVNRWDYNPPRTEVRELPQVTHAAWLRLTEPERVAIIERAVLRSTGQAVD